MTQTQNDMILVSKRALCSILGDYTQYYVEFTRALGDVSAGVFASKFFSWAGKGKDPNGWIYKTQSQIEEETGLTRKNQETARRILRERGLLEEKLSGVPAKLHYRVNIDGLFDLVSTGDYAPIQIDHQIDVDPQRIIDLSKTMYMTAKKSDPGAPYINYVDLVVSNRAEHDGHVICGKCGKEITKGITKGIGKRFESLTFGYINQEDPKPHRADNIQPQHVECPEEEGLPSMSSVDNLGCLGQTDLSDLGRQTSVPSVDKHSIYTTNTTINTTGRGSSNAPIQPLNPPKDPPLQIKPNEYLPGLPDNRKKKTGQRAEIGETLAEASRLGVGAERFRVLVDQVLDDLGKKLLADAGDDNALNEGREIALYLLKMSAGQQSDLFFTPKGISGIMEQWRLGWAGGSLPSAKQYKELASAMLAGKVTKDLSNVKQPTSHLDRRSQAKAASDADAEARFGHYNALLDEPFVPDPL